VQTAAELDALRATAHDQQQAITRDTRATYTYVEAVNAWRLERQPLAAWTPNFTGLNEGNATVRGRVERRSNIIRGDIEYRHGSTSSISGEVQFDLPAPLASNVPKHIGTGLFVLSGGNRYLLFASTIGPSKAI